MNVDLDHAIGDLYVAPRDQFVKDRDALARRLRDDGDRAAAADVHALRKPTVVAWTVNQLAHTNRRDVDLLLDAGKRIIDAQRSSIAKGGRTELDAAQKSLREAVNGLTESAGTILGPDASTTILTRIAETLRTAATAPTARELLARGRLTQEMSETGWDIVATFPQPTRRAKPKPKPKSNGEPAAPSRAAELADHAQQLQSLETSYAAARKRQDGARKKERAAAEHLAELQAARAAADEELELLEKEIASAEQRLAELRGEDG